MQILTCEHNKVERWGVREKSYDVLSISKSDKFCSKLFFLLYHDSNIILFSLISVNDNSVKSMLVVVDDGR